MNISKYSQVRIKDQALNWKVDREYYEPLYNFLVHGFEPGGFWYAVLCNDFYGAIQRSHPGNQIEALKRATGWIWDRFPREAFGDRDRVYEWTRMPAEQRRMILEEKGLIYTEEDEVMMHLRGVEVVDPIMW